MINDLVAIMCPPFADYPEQPTDMSKCILVDCPICNNKMWLSEKKQIAKEFSEAIEKIVFLACYDCFAKEMSKLKDTGEVTDLTEFKRIDL